MQNETNNHADEPLTPAQAGEVVGLSARQVLSRCRAGVFKHLRYNSRVIRIMRSDAEAFRDKYKSKTTKRPRKVST